MDLSLLQPQSIAQLMMSMPPPPPSQGVGFRVFGGVVPEHSMKYQDLPIAQQTLLARVPYDEFL